jgi:ribosomal protein L14E/L6E/L27E
LGVIVDRDKIRQKFRETFAQEIAEYEGRNKKDSKQKNGSKKRVSEPGANDENIKRVKNDDVDRQPETSVAQRYNTYVFALM